MKSNSPFKAVLRLLGCLILFVLVAAVGVYAGAGFLDDPLAADRPDFRPSRKILDRNGELLREILSSREGRSEWRRLSDISPALVRAIVAAEDKRFFRHPGVDPIAVVRSTWLNLRSGQIVSGASTITMQLARMLDPGPRTFKRKVREALTALRLEQLHDKDRILEEYLNRIPCGNLTYGAPAAAREYLGKSADNLSPAEAAFLASLPQAPSALNPRRKPGLVLKRRNWVLDRMAEIGFLTLEESRRAKVEPLELSTMRQRFRAPHFVEFIRGQSFDKSSPVIRTTLDSTLQSQVERIVAAAVEEAESRGIGQAAAIILNHQTREVLAWVGSANFFDPLDGQNDGVTALRQPGSTVKPFTYASAFDRGRTPADIILDAPVEYGLDRGVYQPTNYDNRYRGEVTLRTALASSLNIPAVKLLNETGLTRVQTAMKLAGLTSLHEDPEYYGLGLTLGAGEVTLLELANAYATLASGGLASPPVFFLDTPAANPQRVFSPQACFLVTDILSDDTARASGFGRDSLLALPFPAAAKTGTSKNFRDNWAVGYTNSLVVAVWAGNFDARPMGRVSGITGAGPLWRQVMRLAAEYEPPQPFAAPLGVARIRLCAETNLRASEYCPNQRSEWFMDGHQPTGYCLRHGLEPAAPGSKTPVRAAGTTKKIQILSPKTGERYMFDPGIEPEFQNMALQAAVPPRVDTVAWFVNGQEIRRLILADKPLAPVFWPVSRGRLDLKVVGFVQGEAVGSETATIDVY